MQGWRAVVLVGVLVACGCGQGASEEGPLDAAAAAPVSACADADRSVDLTGTWQARVRVRRPGADWGDATALGVVWVPGWYFPFPRFPTEDLDAELVYERALTWPAAWACDPSEGWRALVEFDSADYRAVVRLDDAALGEHVGYLERFAVPLPWKTSGTLVVSLGDGVRDVESRGGVEHYPHTTLQGVDTGGWGVNPVGLPGGVRLRLVRGAYLRAVYAAVVEHDEDATRLRVGLAVEAFVEGPLRARIRVVDPDGRELALDEAPLALGDGEAFVEVAVPPLPRAGVGAPPPEHRVEVTLLAGDAVADARNAPLVNRQVALVGASLQVNGHDHFARGAGLHHLYRALGVGTADDAPGSYVALDDDKEAAYTARLREAMRAGARWIRPGHFLPDPVFLRAARRLGLLVYQDFPLHWNTDLEALPPAEIARQLRGFLWRVAAEPAVALVATHNEAEFEETDPDELAQVQTLLHDLRDIAARTAPHLLTVACSGCRATARFPPAPEYAIAEPIADAHGYPGSWWQPHVGYRALGTVVQRLADDPLPVFWSEMGNGWSLHFGYLVAVDDDLEPSAPELVAVRRQIEAWLRGPDGRPLNLRTFYAAVRCSQTQGLTGPALTTCVADQLERGDAALVAWARDYYFADRWRVEGAPTDPLAAGALISAHWLATQIFESRWQWAQEAGLLGVIAWERPENAFPFSSAGGRVPAAALERARDILAAANAPVAASLAVADDALDVRLVNDGSAAAVDLRLWAGETEVWSGTHDLPARAGDTLRIELDPRRVLDGQVLRLEARVEGALVSEARVQPRP